MTDTVDFIMAYEGGELDDEEIITGFQTLIDNGMAWSLQGHYGRTATALIEAGHCTAKKEITMKMTFQEFIEDRGLQDTPIHGQRVEYRAYVNGKAKYE